MELRLFRLAHAALGLNLAVVLVYGPLYLRELEPDRAELLIGLLFALPSFTAFLGVHLWGLLYDRYPRPRQFTLITLTGESCYFSLLLTGASAPFMVGATGFFAFFSVACIPAAQAWSTLASPDAKGEILGKLGAMKSCGWATGMLIGGGLWAWTDRGTGVFPLLFGLCAAGSFSSLAAVAALFPRLVTSPPPRESRSLLEELGALYRRKQVLTLGLFLFVLSAANASFFSYFSVYLCDFLGGTRASLSLSMAVATVLGAFLFPLFGRFSDRFGSRRLLVGSTLAYSTFYLAACFVSSPVVLAVLYALPIYPAVRVAAFSLLADVTGQHERGGGMGLLEGISTLASLAGPLCGWLAVSQLGYAYLPFVPLTLMCAGFVLLYRISIRLREAPRQPAPEAA